MIANGMIFILTDKQKLALIHGSMRGQATYLVLQLADGWIDG